MIQKKSVIISGEGMPFFPIFANDMCQNRRLMKNNKISIQAISLKRNNTMKKIFFIFMLMLVASAASAQSCPDDNHPHAIDLGLPSGTKWACCNVGADKPEAKGGYYAWGETEEKNSYDLYNYFFFSPTSYYQNIGSDIAGTEYDVAHVKWGEGWQMPSFDRIKELVRGCSFSWTTMNGVVGGMFTSKYNGAIIFMPANGYQNGTNNISLNAGGYYWSGTGKAESLGSTLSFVNDEADFWFFFDRWYGLPVRPTTGGTDIMPLILSTDTVNLLADQKTRVTITSGSDNYSVVSSNPDVASVTIVDMISDVVVEIRAFQIGETTVTVKDEKSGQSADIQVFVNDTYFPEGTVWEEERHCYYENGQKYLSSYYRNTVEGDTTINGKTYKNVLLEMRTYDEQHYDDEGFPVYGWDRESPWHWMSMGHYYGIREEGNKVYYYGDFFFGYNGMSPQEYLVYDFDWEVGKEIPIYFNMNGKMVCDTITEIDEVRMLDGNTYECIYRPGSEDLRQVKGIGNLSNNGGLFRYLLDFPWDTSTLRYKRVMNFTRNGQLIYQWDRDAFLEEKLDIKAVENEVPTEDEAIYTCDGRRVTQGTGNQRLPKGIYVKKGRLFVVK